jgi:hypothetical protein
MSAAGLPRLKRAVKGSDKLNLEAVCSLLSLAPIRNRTRLDGSDGFTRGSSNSPGIECFTRTAVLP